MTAKIEMFEALVSDLEMIDGATGAIFASFTWSYTMSLANVLVKLRALDREDFFTLQAFEERVERFENRADEIRSIISYLVRSSNPDFLPTGNTVMNLLGQTTKQITDQDLQNLVKEAFELTEAELNEALKQDEQNQKKQIALQTKTIELHREQLITEIDHALNHAGYYDPDTLFQTRDIVFLLEKLATKCEQYEQRRIASAFRTRREKRIKQLASERKILIDIMNKADALADRLMNEEENATQESPLEILARGAA